MNKVLPRAAILRIAATFISVSSFYSAPLWAQAEVVDPLPLGGNQNSHSNHQAAPQENTSGQAAISAEFYYQFQALQQEVMQLRGLVEEQAYEIKKLKQQRLDDYLELDRRIGQMKNSAPSAVSPTAQSSNSLRTTPAPADELKQYRAAIDLLLKQQDQDGAIAALNKHLEDYPKGRYAANAQYWLGETYLLKGDLEASRKWFSQLIAEFPAHNKVPDAKFKLAKVYDQMGNKEEARKLLEDVAQSGSSAAGLARDYLNTKL